MMLRRAAYLLIFGLIAVGTLNSFTAVSGATDLVDASKRNYWEGLKREESELRELAKSSPRDSRSLRLLALTRREEGDSDESEKLLRQLWDEDVKASRSGYNEAYIKDALTLADIYIERSGYDAAFYCHKSILQYDRGALAPDDWRIGRDLNNFGLCYFVAGQCVPDAANRKRYFDTSLECYRQAQVIFEKQNRKSDLALNLNNQALSLRELDRLSESRSAQKESEKLLAQLAH